MHLLSIQVRSRSGNVILALMGVVYTAAAVTLATWLVRDSWQAIGRSEMALLLLLGTSAIAGVWFVRIALESLGMLHRTTARGLPHFRRRHSGVPMSASVQ